MLQLFRALTLMFASPSRQFVIVALFRVMGEPINRNTDTIAPATRTHQARHSTMCWQLSHGECKINHQKWTCAVHELFNKNVHAFLVALPLIVFFVCVLRSIRSRQRLQWCPIFTAKIVRSNLKWNKNADIYLIIHLISAKFWLRFAESNPMIVSTLLMP